MAQTAFAVLPPIITIVLALLTKEVYMSLIIGIMTGAFLFTGGAPLDAVITMFAVMEKKVGGNVNILVFLVILGILVAAITRSGATRAYGEWASRSVKGEKGALLVTALLGLVIFIDDYFNCLTVGTVMRPVTDRFKIARAKLAYVIDSTAAPICIIAPVSSWAAAVGSSLPEGSDLDGFSLFLQTIPINLYALLTLMFMFFIVLTGADFGKMAKTVEEARENFTVPEEYRDTEIAADSGEGKGGIIDLVAPLSVLIAACVYGMLYTGGINEGKSIADAFADCDASKSLAVGSFIAFVFTGLLYLPRRILSFNAFCDSFSRGFKAMTPAIFILCLAWTLSGVLSDDYMNLGGFVGNVVSANTGVITALPPIFFIVAVLLAFATGTSWGTFGILIPIAVAVLAGVNDTSMLVISIAAILSGAVAGDHASPISDTTILASAGAKCHHLDHVETQLPYVILVSTASFFGYVADGFTGNGFVGLAVGAAILATAMGFLYVKKR